MDIYESEKKDEAKLKESIKKFAFKHKWNQYELLDLMLDVCIENTLENRW